VDLGTMVGSVVAWSRLQWGRWWLKAVGEVWWQATGSGSVSGASNPVSTSSASPCCSFKGVGSGWWLSSSASWPSSGWATAGVAVAH
jgi:hypothetical protein